MKVAPNLQSALDHAKAGGIVAVCTATRTIAIEQKHINAWDKAGRPLLRTDGNGYRMQSGKSSVYLFANQLFLA